MKTIDKATEEELTKILGPLLKKCIETVYSFIKEEQQQIWHDLNISTGPDRFGLFLEMITNISANLLATEMIRGLGTNIFQTDIMDHVDEILTMYVDAMRKLIKEIIEKNKIKLADKLADISETRH